MRPRTRDAVSWRVSQIGRKTSSTSSVPISFSNLGRSGAAWVLSVDSHCSRCLAFRNPDEILVTSSSANSPNVFVPALDRLSLSGSVPLNSRRRASAALRRASCNERPGFFGPGAGPRPISQVGPFHGFDKGRPNAVPRCAKAIDRDFRRQRDDQRSKPLLYAPTGGAFHALPFISPSLPANFRPN